MEKKASTNAKPTYNFKISRRRTNTLRRKKKKSLKEADKAQGPGKKEQKKPLADTNPLGFQKEEASKSTASAIPGEQQPPPSQSQRQSESNGQKTVTAKGEGKQEVPPSSREQQQQQHQHQHAAIPKEQPKEQEDDAADAEKASTAASPDPHVQPEEEPEPKEVSAAPQEQVTHTPAPQEEVKATPAPQEEPQEEGGQDEECPFPCVAKYEFKAVEETELSLAKGVSVMILQISETGWCLARDKDSKEGWVPMDYLERIEDEALEQSTADQHAKLESDKASAAAAAAESPLEPQRVSPLGDENQKLFEYLQTSQLFHAARSKGEMKVQIEDLHLTLATGGGLDMTLAIMRWMDASRIQVADFQDLQTRMSKIKGAWAEHRMILKMKRKWSDDDAMMVMAHGLGGVETLDMLRDYHGTDAQGAVKHIQDKRAEMKKEEEQGRTALLDYLSSTECTLFKENCSVSQAALDALFDKSTPAQVMEKVKGLNAEKKVFDSFEALVEAVSGNKVKSAKKPADNKSFQPVLQYLASPQCMLFRAAGGLRINSNAIRELLDSYDMDVQRLLCDVSVLNALNVSLTAFKDLKPALEQKEVRGYKEKLFGMIKDPNGTHFTSTPTEFPEDEMYGVLAVSTTRIECLPQILQNLITPVSSLDELCTTVEEIIASKATQEQSEQDKVVQFLSKFGMFSKQFPLTVPDVQKMIWASQFSKWGLRGGSVEDVLKALHEAGQVFESFEGLTNAVAEKANKMGQAMSDS